MILSTDTLSGITEKSSIFEDIDFELGTNSTSFPLADKLRLANKWYLKTGLKIWKASSTGTWKFNNKNATTLPTYYSTLVAGQYDYTLPTTAIAIQKVRVLDSSGKFYELEYSSDFETPENQTNGRPTKWKVEGYSLILDVPPSASYVTLTDGIELDLSLQLTKFTKSDAAVSPGFEEQFHDIICKGVAYDFCRKHTLIERASFLKAEINELFKDLEDFFAGRNEAARSVISRKRTSYN